MAGSTSQHLYVKNFKTGLVTRIEKESVGRGGASDSLNWHFLGDHIELRRGQQRVGSLVDGSGKVTFVHVGRLYDDSQILFWGYLRKILRWDEDTEAEVEIGSDVLPELASGEDVSATNYQSFAGAFSYLSSPNSSVYKLVTANPSDIVDQQQDTYRGYIKAMLGRMALWNRKDKFGGSDKTGIYLSTIDRDSLADYDFTSAEVIGTGDGATASFSATLAFKALNSKKTCHFARIAGAIGAQASISAITAAAVPTVTTSAAHGFVAGNVLVIQGVAGMTQINNRIVVVATVPTPTTFTIDLDTSGFSAYTSGGSATVSELFTDDRVGGLVGSSGGTGTINYATGAIAVTFSAVVLNGSSVTADYYTEDSTDEGVLDFTNGDGSSIADSQTFRQDDGGFFQNFGIIGSIHYCFHTIKTYALRLISSADMTNLPYRNRVGIPSARALVETGEGIYYLDVTTESTGPAVRLLEPSRYGAENDIPRTISNQLDLSGYEFDQCVMFEWGNYILMECRTSDSAVNNRLFMYHKIWESWELHDFRISDMDSYNGVLHGGDSGSNNLYKLFSGLTDEDAFIPNHFITGNDYLDKEGVKDLRRFKIAGLIGDGQKMKVSYSVDNEDFVEVGGTDVPIVNNPLSISQLEANGNIAMGVATWAAQKFTTGSDPFTLNSITVKMLKGNPVAIGGTIRCGIYASSGGVPTGSELAGADYDGNTVGSSAQLVPFSFDGSILLEANTDYVFVISAPGATNAFTFNIQAKNGVSDGGRSLSTNSGGTWVQTLTDNLYHDINGIATVPGYHIPLIVWDGEYVDQSKRGIVGALTLGTDVVGGGADDPDAIYAAPYELEFYVGTPRFERIRFKFEAQEAGYLSISEYGFVDYRDKGRRLPTKYVQ